MGFFRFKQDNSALLQEIETLKIKFYALEKKFEILELDLKNAKYKKYLKKEQEEEDHPTDKYNGMFGN